MANITNITPPRVPLTDARTGLISREWYLFFLSLFTQTGQSSGSTDDLQKGPPAAETVDMTTLMGQVDLTSANLAPLEASVAKLAADMQAFDLLPPVTPHMPRLRYGSFYDTTDQTAAVINTAYAMTFNATDLSQGVYLGTPTSRVYVDTSNVYNIQFSAQLLNAAGGAHDVWIWIRKNGLDVPNTATALRIEGNNTQDVAAWNFLLSLNAGDYFELMWEVSDVSVTLQHSAATAVHPAIPSIILTVTDNISS